MFRNRLALGLHMAGYWGLNVIAGLCFKEGGSDGARRWWYFLAGNAAGITSTALLMGIYARMNVNLALAIVTSGTFFLLQLAFCVVFGTVLSLAQWLGIALASIGIALALRSGKDAPAAEERQAVESTVLERQEKR